jgi:hypothetical protein
VAFKLNKTQIKERDRLAAALRESGDAMVLAVTTFNEELETLKEPLIEALTAYNVLLAETKEFVEGFLKEAQGDFEDKTETWQDGEKGEQAKEWLDAWEELDLEEIDFDFPDPIAEDFDSSEHAVALEEAPEEA